MSNPHNYTTPQYIYLDLLSALNYPEQQPEYLNATYRHLLLLLIPIMGPVLFIEAVKATVKTYEG